MSPEKTLSLPGGRTLAYEDSCNPNSDVVVILFFGLLSVGNVRRTSPVLESKGVHFVSPTLPGYGNTSPPAKGVSYAATMASDISALIEYLHPDSPGLELHIGGASFGTIPAQMLYGAPFDVFPAGRHLKRLLLLSAFAPPVNDKEKGFTYTKDMSWSTYFGVGPPTQIIPFRILPRLTKFCIKFKLSTQGGAEQLLRQFMFDEMDEKERELFTAWKEKEGVEDGQLERELAQMNRRSVEKSWKGFLSTGDVYYSDWGWGVKRIEDLDEEHTAGRKVLVIAGRRDTSTPGEWGEYLASKYVNSRIKWLEGGHLSSVFFMDEIWSEFLEF